MLRRLRQARTAQPRVHVPGCAFALSHRDGDRSLAGHHIPTSENSGVTGHHVRADLDGPVRSEFDVRHLTQEFAVALLTQRQHDRIRLERLEASRGLRPPLGIELHHLNDEIRANDLLDRGQPLYGW